MVGSSAIALGLLALGAQTADPFTWLEGRRDPKALEWVLAQNQRTVAAMEADPRYARNYGRAMALATAEGQLPGRTGWAWLHQGWIYDVWTSEAHPRGILRRLQVQLLGAAQPAWETLLDVDALAATEGKTYTLSGGSCFDTRCLLPLSDGASELAWREFDIERRAFVPAGFTFKSDLQPAWKDANTLLVGMADRLVEWSRGSRLEQARIVRQSAPPAATLYVGAMGYGDGQRQMLIVMELGVKGDARYWRMEGGNPLTPVQIPVYRAMALYRDQWVFALDADWTSAGQTWQAGSIVSVSDVELAGPSPRARLVWQPGERESVDAMQSTADGLLLVSHENVRGRLSRFTLEKGQWARARFALPDFGNVDFALHTTGGSAPLVMYESFLQPPTYYTLDVAAAHARPVKSSAAQFDAEAYVTEQFEAVSRDGTRVPYFLVRAKNLACDGQTPTLMYAYGGNGTSLYPHYSGDLGRLWLDQGGAYVLANIRGGGELGPGWHFSAVRTRRHRSFEDFVAVAQDLFRRKITSPRRLGINGHSNGGGLVGVMLTQHPELFNAVVAENGVLDWIRNDLQSASDSIKLERGSPEIPEERAFLDRVSPYQNLRKRDRMPVPLLATSTTDDTVYPAMTRKFAARMDALQLPYYFYEAPEGGHGMWITPDQRARWQALKFTYLAQRLMDAPRRPFTVADSIEWTNVVNFGGDISPNPPEGTASLSADGERLLIHVRRGELSTNRIIETLLMFRTDEVRSYLEHADERDPPSFRVALRLPVSSDAGMISSLRWIGDREIAFLAQGSNGIAQAFVADVESGQRREITHSETPVAAFAIAQDRALYYAHAKPAAMHTVEAVGERTLGQVLFPPGADSTPLELFQLTVSTGAVVRVKQAAVRLYEPFHRIWMSASGRFAIIFIPATDAPATWAQYRIPEYARLGYTASRVSSDPASLDLIFRTRYALVDLDRNISRPLLDAPSGWLSQNGTPLDVFWTAGDRAVIVTNTYLPLEGTRQPDVERLRSQPAITEFDLRSGRVTPVFWEPALTDEGRARGSRQPFRIAAVTWDAATQQLNVIERRRDPVTREVTFESRLLSKQGEGWVRRAAGEAVKRDEMLQLQLHQSLNERPRVHALQGAADKPIFDPNPQADLLRFGQAEPLDWDDAEHKIRWHGGLLYPVDFRAGETYPLIVQTHGFDPGEFLLDGPSSTAGGSTAMSAQVFANHGFLVLQVEDNGQASTGDEREGPLFADGLRAGIGTLIERGLADPARIGLIGFSRTGLHAIHFLAKYPKMLAAASICDAAQPGYLQNALLSVNLSKDLIEQTGAVWTVPMDEAGIAASFARDPLYRLAQAAAAIRIEADSGRGALLTLWETYALLKLAGKPVDFVYFPEGQHVQTRPAERLESQGGNLDWFRFWLKGEEDLDDAKKDQYRRWRALRLRQATPKPVAQAAPRAAHVVTGRRPYSRRLVRGDLSADAEA